MRETAYSQDAKEVQEEFVFGRRSVLEALKGQRALNKILLQEDASGGSLNEILAVAREQRVIVQKVPKAKMNEIVGERSHQGVIAYISAKEYVELEDLIQKAKSQKPGLLILLDGIEDPHNLGSILRAADGSGAAGVIIPKRRAVPLTGTVAKASAGALEHVDVARVSNIGQAMERLKEAGFWVVGAAPEAKEMYWQVDYSMPVALVIGAEGEGIGRLTSERCDILVGLPMRGQVNSLNAGVATGIILYEILRQRLSK
ncbi:MAG: 23S rRNA (guanosine(2251)-2'-O)-methyltransferase RlmB [Acidibacillus sp.]|nr:23S rRNA (guanosine(2251)-2'-O)-methyltransferase RlmB [Acidibacillus sp.]